MENKQLTILLVDDEPEILNLFKAALDQSIYDIFTAEDANTAIEMLKTTQLDIVVSDFKMPGEFSGIDILYHINSNNLNTKFILQTAFATVELAIKAMKNGAFDFLLKPVNILHFTAVVEKCASIIKTERENTELKSDNERLNELNKLKEKFITITNHELRTPLTILKGYTDLLECYMEDIDSNDIKQSVDTIQTTLSDFEYVIKRMHSASRLNHSKYTYEPKQLNLNTFVEEIITQFKIITTSREISIHFECQEESIDLTNDPNLLKKALREIIQNSVRFTPNGGHVNVSLIQKNDIIELTIQDSGVGIPKESMEYIFDMFYEAQDVMHHSTSQSNFMGSSLGIGLYLVKEISEICSFEIKVKSQPSNGTQFILHFANKG